MKKLVALLLCFLACATQAQTTIPDQRPHRGQEAYTNKANNFTKTQTINGSAILTAILLGPGFTITPGTNNAGPAISTSTIYPQMFPNIYTGNHTVSSGENMGLDVANSASALTFTLAQAGTAGFETGTSYLFLNSNTGLVTISTTTSVFKGAPLTGSNITLGQNQSVLCDSDGTNWQCMFGRDNGGVYANGNSGTSMALNCDNGRVQSVTISGAVTFTFTTPKTGCEFTVLATQDGTGHAYGYPAATVWPGGTAPSWSSSASAKDSATFKYDGSTFWGQGNTAYATSR